MFKSTYRSTPGWEEAVINATAADPKVRASVLATAERVAGAASANAAATAASADERRLAPEVAGMVAVKDMREFTREKVHSGTRIPIALVVSDHWASQWFEIGHGMRFAATHFMRAAAHVGKGKFFPRGLGR